MNTTRCRTSQFLFRVINIACAIFVSSYIFLDFLDLDGSKWPLTPHPITSEILVVQGLAEAEPIALPNMVENWEKDSNYFIAPHRVSRDFCASEAPIISARLSCRLHRYRVALPRSSVPDSFVLA